MLLLLLLLWHKARLLKEVWGGCGAVARPWEALPLVRPSKRLVGGRVLLGVAPGELLLRVLSARVLLLLRVLLQLLLRAVAWVTRFRPALRKCRRHHKGQRTRGARGFSNQVHIWLAWTLQTNLATSVKTSCFASHT